MHLETTLTLHTKINLDFLPRICQVYLQITSNNIHWYILMIVKFVAKRSLMKTAVRNAEIRNLITKLHLS